MHLPQNLYLNSFKCAFCMIFNQLICLMVRFMVKTFQFEFFFLQFRHIFNLYVCFCSSNIINFSAAGLDLCNDMR